MSMSQEEIESLMNGLDFADEEPAKEPEVEEDNSNETMSEDDINELIAQTEEVVPNETKADEASVDELLNSIEEANENEEPKEEVSEASVDDILNELEDTGNQNEDTPAEEVVASVEENKVEVVDTTPVTVDTPNTGVEEPKAEDIPDTAIDTNEDVSSENIDDILASIDGMTDDEPEPIKEESTPSNNDEKDHNKDLDDKINRGVFPFPVEQDTKVVNQLSQVANDSEEKATKIFDVLSNILDYNNGIQNDVQELSKFNDKQVAMLNSLNQKFPSIEAFKENLEQAKSMGSFITSVNDKLNNGNMEIFQAMELMQYHDINRQKIERVMSVIRKLSIYLNNLFEDEGSHDEIAVAKHIHGDNDTDDLMGDEDLESLIAEFNK